MRMNANYRRWRRIFIWSMSMIAFMGLYFLFEQQLVNQYEVVSLSISEMFSADE